MPLFDRIVAIVMLSLLAGALAIPAIRAWADYRRQRRAVDLLVRSVTEIETPKKAPRT